LYQSWYVFLFKKLLVLHPAESCLIPIQVKILDELAVNLRQRQTINRVDRDYDGAVPTEPIENITIGEEDIAVMWKVFDYAEISREQGHQKPTTPSSVSVSDQQLPETNPTQESEAGFPASGSSLGFASANVLIGHQDANSGSLEFEIEDFDPHQRHDFGEDWMLMGRLWSEYFPGDL
jgi:hypothetical protein